MSDPEFLERLERDFRWAHDSVFVKTTRSEICGLLMWMNTDAVLRKPWRDQMVYGQMALAKAGMRPYRRKRDRRTTKEKRKGIRVRGANGYVDKPPVRKAKR